MGTLVVDDEPPDLAAITEAAAARLAGQRVSVARLLEAARALNDQYVSAGHVLARVVVPPQTLSDGGAVHFRVIDGRIARVDTSAIAGSVRPRIDAVLADLPAAEPVLAHDLERALLLAGETPGVQLRSTLTPGEAPGTTDLVVNGSWRPVTVTLGFDTALDAALGSYESNLGVDFNGIAGLGELVYLRIASRPQLGNRGIAADTPRIRSLASGFDLPLDTDGVTLNVELAETRTTPVASAAGLVETSTYQRLALHVLDAAWRSRSFTLNVDLGLDVTEERVSALAPVAAPISLDRLRILRGRLSGSWIPDATQTLTADLGLSVGLDVLGARGPGDATAVEPLSRQGARPDFRSLTGSVTYSDGLAEHLVVQVGIRAQSSFGAPLPASEQLGLATPDGISALSAGTLEGDGGGVVRAELQSPWGTAIGEAPLALQPYGFVSFGWAQLAEPSALEHHTQSARAYGLGLRSAITLQDEPYAVLLSLELGRARRDPASPESDRLMATASVQF